MEKIKCTIERITFQNPENGYSVLQATIKGYRDEQTLVGTFHEVTVGAVLTVEGNWRVDKRYGRQFAVEKWTEELPADIIGIEKYLGSGLVKGIGPKFAKLIVAKFGLDTFNVIENEPDKLLEVYGIAPKELEKSNSFFCPIVANLRQQMWHFPLNSICFHHFSLIIFGLKTIFSQVFIFYLQPLDC